MVTCSIVDGNVGHCGQGGLGAGRTGGGRAGEEESWWQNRLGAGRAEAREV
jgi:hypothetical protein